MLTPGSIRVSTPVTFFGAVPILLSMSAGNPCFGQACTWMQRATGGPSHRTASAMAYDSDRGVAVLFGGYVPSYVGDTWEWDGLSWTQRSNDGPTPRWYPAMAYDRARGVTVLFGGEDSAHVPFHDTWEWDGTVWTLRSLSGPPPRHQHAMAYDSVRGVTIMFGGYNPSDGFLGDTWEWDGSTWILRSSNGPSPRERLAMDFDSVRGVTVLFGGISNAFGTTGDTWEWNGSTWVLRSNNGPAPREGHAMAYDSARGVSLLFGGNVTSVGRGGDTWEWNGIAWTQRSDSGPPPRDGHAMTYDIARRATVLFGGELTSVGYIGGDTWEFAGDCSPQACCLTSGQCIEAETTACIDAGGIPKGSGSACLGDTNGDGVDQLCEGDCDQDGILDGNETDPAQRDCNHNGVCNGMEIASCLPGVLACTDCNGNSIPDGCDIASGTSSDCNANGIPDECEYNSATFESFSVFGAVPETIALSQGTYAPGFFIPELSTETIYHVSPDGSTVSSFAVGMFAHPVDAIFAPNEFGGLGTRLFVCNQNSPDLPIQPAVVVVDANGTVSSFADTPGQWSSVTGLVHIPSSLGGPNAGSLIATDEFDPDGFNLVGSIFRIDSNGAVSLLVSPVGVQIFTPALAPLEFNPIGNSIFVGQADGSLVLRFDPLTNNVSEFSSVDLAPGQTGLRQIAFSPIGWFAPLAPNLADKSLMVISISGSQNGGGTNGSLAILDAAGSIVARFTSSAPGRVFDPRGLLFDGDHLLVSNAAAGHAGIVSLTISDFLPPDCNNNGITDLCDISSGASTDMNGNGIPDECELSAPQPDPSGIDKVRYLSFLIPSPSAGPINTAQQVRLVSLMHPDPPNLPQFPAPDFAAQEGTVRYAGTPGDCQETESPPTTFKCATLQCSPVYMDWEAALNGQTLHVTGQAVVPSSTYEVRQLAASCQGNEATCAAISAQLIIATARWGDVSAAFQAPSPAPLTQPNISDVAACVDKFKAVATAIIVARADVNPAVPNSRVDIADVASIVDAFKNLAYPFPGPSACP